MDLLNFQCKMTIANPHFSNFVQVPDECPSCATGGIRSSVKFYQINMEEAAVFCENASVLFYFNTFRNCINVYLFFQCPFPLFSQNACPLVVSHAAASALTAAKLPTKLKPRSMDTDSLASSCSGQYYFNILSCLVILYLFIINRHN